MKGPLHALAILTGLVGLLANILAIARYLGEGQAGLDIQNRGLLTVVTFVALAYGLSMGSVLLWRWTHRRSASPAAARSAAVLLNILAALPLLALWFRLVLSTLFPPATNRVESWLIALAMAWIAAPFIGLGLAYIGELLGPLLMDQPP